MPDAILIAGGDGTICEVITGLLRRSGSDRCAIGVVPVGRTNTLGGRLFGTTKLSKLKDVESIANAAMSVVQGKTESKDVMKIEIIPPVPHQTTEIDATATVVHQPPKPIYAIGALDWGTFRDAKHLRDKYWYFGSYRDYVTFVFNAFNDNLTWTCKAKLAYSDPCTGCSNCFEKRKTLADNGRWWSKFVPKFGLGQANKANEVDYSKVNNPTCKNVIEIDVDPSDINITPSVHRVAGDDLSPAKLTIRYNHQQLDGFSFITKSWQRVRSQVFEAERTFDARTVHLVPETISSDDKEMFFSIDNEAFEVKPIRISVVPRAIQLYTL